MSNVASYQSLDGLTLHPDPARVRTGFEARKEFRNGKLDPFTQTTGLAPGYMQASPVIVPKEMALEFLTLCQRNPKPCPVVAVSDAGVPSFPTVGGDIDLRTDLGGYRIWRNGELAEEVTDISNYWRDDFVSFAIGCSYSFEDAMVAAGLDVRHQSEGRCVPMYRTNIPLASAGRFRGRPAFRCARSRRRMQSGLSRLRHDFP